MPVQILSEIMDAYFKGVQLKQAREQFAQRQALDEAQFAEGQKQFDTTLKRLTDQFNAQQKFNQAQFNLTKARATPDLFEAAGQGMYPSTDIPGEMAQTDMGPMQMPGSQQIQIPGLEGPETITGPSKEMMDYRKREESKRKIFETVEAFRQLLPLQEQLARTRDADVQARIDMEAVQRGLDRESRERIAKLNATTRAARQNQNKLLDEDTIQDRVQMALDGDFTVEDFSKHLLPEPARRQLFNATRAAGGTMLKDKVVTELKALGTVTQIIRDADTFKEKIKQGRFGLTSEGKIQLRQLQAERNQLISRLGEVARGLGSQSGVLSKLDIEQQMANIPAIFPEWSGDNDERMGRFKAAYHAQVDTSIGTLSKEQRQRLRMKYRILSKDPPKHLRDPQQGEVP